MRHRRPWPRFLALWLVAASLTGASGCMGCFHPIDASHAQVVETCKTMPKCCRDHVYVFLLNGMDPWNYGNMTGLRDYLQSLGLNNVYYGQAYHAWYFEKEIRRIHQHDPEAHFVLVGFSVGVNVVDSMARTVKKDNIYIDLLVFLSGNHPVMPMPKDQPGNVGRVINILADGVMGSRGERGYAENTRLMETHHFDPPTHPSTLEMLTRELSCLVQMVNIPEPLPKPVAPSPEDAPTPRPVKIPTSIKKDEWDFLKPVARLAKPPSYFQEETVTLKPVAGNPQK